MELAETNKECVFAGNRMFFFFFFLEVKENHVAKSPGTNQRAAQAAAFMVWGRRKCSGAWTPEKREPSGHPYPQVYGSLGKALDTSSPATAHCRVGSRVDSSGTPLPGSLSCYL